MLRGALLLTLCAVTTAYNRCMDGGMIGVCINLKNCMTAIEGINNGRYPTICSYQRYEPVVCCLDYTKTTTTTTTTSATASFPTLESWYYDEYYEPEDYDSDESEENESTCEPIPANLTASKTGRKAWDKCIEYQERLVYPCEKSVALSFHTSTQRSYKCNHNARSLVLGGEAAKRNEFPHMALLGYGDENDTKWVCGGSLISDKFILTAGHCLESRKYGIVKFAYIGALYRSEVTNPAGKYRIKSTIKHPDYHSPNMYNDIALLELETSVKLDKNTVPACLPVGEFDDDHAVATGWGHTAFKGDPSEVLLQVSLTKFSTNECIENLPPDTNFEKGFDANTQTCYGDKEEVKDTCQGDSGGPLQITHPQIKCMYVVIGVTSSGYMCGVLGQPAVYTDVARYVPWIESVVWP